MIPARRRLSLTAQISDRRALQLRVHVDRPTPPPFTNDHRLLFLTPFPSFPSFRAFLPLTSSPLVSLAAYTMSGSVRARRQASPPGRHPQPAPTSQRFPHPRHDHLDADERREAASRGLRPGRKAHVTGGLNLSPGEWKLLAVVLVIASAVRLFRISQPNSVVYVPPLHPQTTSVLNQPPLFLPLASMKSTSANSPPNTSNPPIS